MGKKILFWFAAGICFLMILGVAMLPLEETAQSSTAASSAVVATVASTSSQQPTASISSIAPVTPESGDLVAVLMQTPAPNAVEKLEPKHMTADYILNTNTGKFHIPTCPSVDLMNESNKLPFNGSRDDVVGKGYSPCMNCFP